MIQEFRAEPIQLLQVHHLKVQVHRLLEVNQLKSNQVIDSNYFYNPNYTIKSVKINIRIQKKQTWQNVCSAIWSKQRESNPHPKLGKLVY